MYAEVDDNKCTYKELSVHKVRESFNDLSKVEPIDLLYSKLDSLNKVA